MMVPEDNGPRNKPRVGFRVGSLSNQKVIGGISIGPQVQYQHRDPILACRKALTTV